MSSNELLDNEPILNENDLTTLSDEQIKQLREIALGDLFFFAKGICGFDWLTPAIHGPLCRMLEQYRSKRKLLICLPRGWLKTTLCSQAYPLWRAVRNPEIRVLLAQNTYTNSTAKLSTIKSLVESNALFRLLFPKVLPGPGDTWKADSLCLARQKHPPESTFEAAGIRTQITSRHYDLIIEDDTVAPDLNDLGEENLVPTKDDIQQAIGWHRLVSPLLVNPPENLVEKGAEPSQNIVVGTRWFEKDLISWVEEEESESFSIYKRACKEDEEGNPSESGVITYPDRFSQPVLDSLKISMGMYLFSCLYLNLPLRSEDMVFRPSWFDYYLVEPKSLICYTTVDPAGNPEDTKGEADWNVVITCGKDQVDGRIYVLEASREKCSPGRLISILFDHVKKWSPVVVGIESFAYQKSLLYWTRERMRNENTWFNVEKLSNTSRSKSNRILGLQPVIQSKSLLFRSHHTDLINELLAFPLGSNDDLADALAMQVELWRLTLGPSGLTPREKACDPLNVSFAIEEIRERNLERTKTKGSLVMDVFDSTVSTGDLGGYWQ